MHELSLCSTIYRTVERVSEGRPVSVINLRIGQLRQVVPDTLTYCWTLVSDETDLAGSTIAIESVPVTLSCVDCESETTVEGYPHLICGQCNGTNVEVTTGEEFLLTSLELAEA